MAGCPDTLVILCGCRRACADTDEYRTLAPRHIIIAGESLDGLPRGEKELASLIANRLDL